MFFSRKEQYKTIDCTSFKSFRGDGGYILLDVRELPEWNQGHFEEAVHIPLGTIEDNIEKVAPGKDTQIFVCCAHGGRARSAAKKLVQLGYSDVSNVEGGLYGYCSEVGTEGIVG